MRPFFLREVNKDDEGLILAWKNETECVKNSFSNAVVSPQEHHEWFLKILQDKNSEFYILTDGDKNMGQVRLTMLSGKGTISYSIAPEFRGNGLAFQMLSLLIEKENHQDSKIGILVGEVKKENKASLSIFRKLNFSEKEAKDRYIFELDIKGESANAV